MKFTRAIALNEEGSLIKKSGTKLFRVDKKFQWWLDYNNKHDQVIVDAGFITDFGSIPRFLWWLFNPTEWISYILHDKLYEDRFVIQEDGTKRYIDREEADQILYQALIVEGCSETSAAVQYVGLRMFGWYRWMKS